MTDDYLMSDEERETLEWFLQWHRDRVRRAARGLFLTAAGGVLLMVGMVVGWLVS